MTAHGAVAAFSHLVSKFVCVFVDAIGAEKKTALVGRSLTLISG